MRFSKRSILLAASIFIIVVSVFLQIAKNKVKISPIPYGEELLFTLDNTIPPGDYDLYYYIATSVSDRSTPTMSFALKTDATHLELQSYTSSIGFAISSFTKTTNEDISIIFQHLTNETDAATYAAVGDVYIKSRNRNFEKQLYTPSSWGNSARDTVSTISQSPLQSQGISITPFADIASLSVTNSTLSFTFLCRENITDKYSLALRVTSDVNRIRPNGIRYVPFTLVDEGGWIQGEEYIQSVNLNLLPGDYQIDLTILPEGITNVPIYFSNSKSIISLGSVSVEGQSLSDFLGLAGENHLIILSIMDEGTSALNQNSLQSLADLDLQEDLIKKYRWSYVAITAKGIDGFVNYENLSQDKIQNEFPAGSLFGSYRLPFHLKLESAGYSVGNYSSIIINEAEYSPKRRGINIVIYDSIENKVVETANFDTYIQNYRYLP